MAITLRRLFSWLSPTVTEGDQVGTPGQQSPGTRSVNFDLAMTSSAWWACCKLLSEIISTMPLRCYQGEGPERVEISSHPLWRALRYGPNPHQTGVEFLEVLILNLVSAGNAYNLVHKTARGKIYGFTPLMASQVTVKFIEGEIFYIYRDERGVDHVYTRDQIWHVKIFGNGYVGLSPLAHAAQSLGVSIDSKDRTATISRSGGKHNGLLMYDGNLTKEQRRKIRDNLGELTEGGSEKLFVLDKHFKFERTNLSPQDMKLMEIMQWSVEDVARFMGVPSVLINDTKSTTVWGSGIDQIVQGFYKLTIRPYLIRLQDSMTRWLLAPDERESIHLVFDFDDLIQPDRKTRVETAVRAIQGSLSTPDEERAEFGKGPKPGGDKLYFNGALETNQQKAMVPLVDDPPPEPTADDGDEEAA